jgi:hypothetical protein
MLTIRHYGFDCPPYAVIHLLNCLHLPDDKSFIIYEPLTGVEFPWVAIESLPKENLYVIINTHEGASHMWFDRLLDRLINQGQILKSNIILRSACLYNPDSPIHHVHTVADECSSFVYRFDQVDLTTTVPATHHFVCLNRLHRWQRHQLVIELLDRGLDKFGKISYLEQPNHNDPRFPIILDCVNVSWEQQRDVDDPAIAGALINVITESAYEIEPDISKLEWHHLPGMTEKSFKCFVMHQIPVWLAPYLSVDCYRELGFDVFDDLVDHSYDLEPDPVQRIKLVADQVEILCGLTNLDDLRQQLLPRFLKNINTMKSLSDHSLELPQWQKIFN